MTTPFYPQLEERDCGVTCLRMVLAHHGRSEPVDRLRELTGTNEQGADMAGLAAAARELGFETVAAELSYDELLAPDLWPAILHWDGDHFVVLVSAGGEGVAVLDPAFGERRMDRDTFESHRVGAGRSRGGLLIIPRDGNDLRGGKRPPTRESIVPAETSETPVEASETPAVTPEPPAAEATSISPGAGVDPGSGPSLPVATLLYAGLLAAGFFVLARTLNLSVDLQFREGWGAEVGALIATASAVMLGRHLVRRAGQVAAQRGADGDTSALGDRLLGSARGAARRMESTAAIAILDDVDALRVFRAYRLPDLYLAGATLAVAVVFAFAADEALGAALLALTTGVALLHYLMPDVDPAVRAAAVEAQSAQRTSTSEQARAAEEFHRLGLRADFLSDQTGGRHHAAAAAFLDVARDVTARRELKSVAAMVAALILLSIALYRLGYDGLQVGPLIFLAFLIYISLSHVDKAGSAYQTYRKLDTARSRLREMKSSLSVSRLCALPSLPDEVHLVWRTSSDESQVLTFATESSLGLVGGDEVTRCALIRACLGRPNDRDAVLSLDREGSQAISLRQLGRVALVGDEAVLVSGTVASNITLSARTELAKLSMATERAGLRAEELPDGLSTVIPPAGAGVDPTLRTQILLARALYNRAEIVIVDGGTDGLSAYDEALVIDILAAAPGTRLLVCNSRRPQATIGLDLLAQIEEQEIEAAGTHELLQRAGGAYAVQFAAQLNLHA